MIRPPISAKFSRTANFAARKAMSSTSLASFVTIGCVPQHRASRRAVSRLGVSAMMVALGRERARRRAVEPEWVQAMIAVRFRASTI